MSISALVRLTPDVLYIVTDLDRVQYAVTPDGVGCYWYDTRGEAEAERFVYERTVHTTAERFEEIRNA